MFALLLAAPAGFVSSGPLALSHGHGSSSDFTGEPGSSDSGNAAHSTTSLPVTIATLNLVNRQLYPGVLATPPGDIYASEIAYDSANGYLYASCLGPDWVEVINGTSDTVVGHISVGYVPYGVTYDSANEEIYVANQQSDNVSVINGTTDKLVGSVPAGNGPNMPLYDPANGYVYVTNYYSNNVTVINGVTNRVVLSIAVGAVPQGITYDSVNEYLYVMNSGSNNVSVINGSSNKVIDNINVLEGPQDAAFDSANGEIYVADGYSHSVSIIEGANGKVVDNITSGFFDPQGVGYDNVNGYVYVTNSGSNSVTVINGTTNTVVEMVKVNDDPFYVATSPVTGVAYVASMEAGTINFIRSGVSEPSYQIVFTESGTPSGTPWSVALGASSNMSTRTTVGFTEPNGTYPYVVEPATGYASTPSTGVITITGTNPPPVSIVINQTPLSSVVISGLSSDLFVEGSLSLTVSPTCGMGQCAAGTTYVWSLNNTMGHLNSTSGSSILFTAGPIDGAVAVTVTATLGGQSVQGSYDLNIISPPTQAAVVLSTLDMWNNTLLPGNYLPPNGLEPSAVAIDPIDGDAYVVNYATNNVAVIDLANDKAVAWITVGSDPDGIAFDASNGDLYVTNYDSGNVSIIDGSTNTIAGSFSSGTAPLAVVYDSTNGYLYVGDANCIHSPHNPCADVLGSVAVFNATTDAYMESIPVGSEPSGLALDNRNDCLYVGDEAPSIGNSYYLTVINTSTAISVGQVTIGAATFGITFDNHDGLLYVAAYSSDYVAVVDPTSNAVTTVTQVGDYPEGIAYDSSNGYLYIANSGSGNVSFIDSSTNTIAGSVQVGDSPSGLALDNSTGQLYVTSADSNNVSVISTTTGTVTKSIHIGSNDMPEAITYDPANEQLYLANYNANNVSVVSGTTDTVVGSVKNPPSNILNPDGAAFDSGNGYLYVANEWSNDVSIINATTDTVSMVVLSESAPSAVAYDSNNGLIYVANIDSDNLTVINGSTNATTSSIMIGTSSDGIACDGANGYLYVSAPDRDTVSVMNPSTGNYAGSVSVGMQPEGIAYDSANGYLYVADSWNNSVTVINGATNTVVKWLIVGLSPNAITFDPRNGFIYVTNSGSDNLAVINGTSNTIVGSVAVGLDPMGIVLDSTNGYLYVTNAVSGTVSIVSTLVVYSIVVNPSTATLTTGGTLTFSATPLCTGASCPSGVTYSWLLTNGLGTLSSATGSSVTFTAGSSPGGGTLFVNATFDGVTVQSTPTTITITTLSYVSVTPSSATLATHGSVAFTASPLCVGTICPSGVTYTWSVNNSLGSLNTTTGPSISFAAGPTSGVVRLTVTANLNGKEVSNSSSITIIPTISSVSEGPSSTMIPVGGSAELAASPFCAGNACPPGVTYSWAMNNSLGSLNSVTFPSVTFTAGPVSGIIRLTVTATLNGKEVSNSSTITIVPTIASVSVNPPSVTIPLGGLPDVPLFTASSSCAGGSCPANVSYSWSLSNDLGTLNASAGQSVVVDAHGVSGVVALFVNATLDAKTVQSSPVLITIVQVLYSVKVTPSSDVLTTGGSASLTATPDCATLGNESCPPGVVYTWSITSGLGVLNTTSGPTVTVTAGSIAGNTTLFVNVTLNGRTVQCGPVVITIDSPQSPSKGPTFMGLPGVWGYVVLWVIVAVIAVALAVILLRRWKKVQPNPQPGPADTSESVVPAKTEQRESGVTLRKDRD
jgi:YVTN family beta-propeller protein